MSHQFCNFFPIKIYLLDLIAVLGRRIVDHGVKFFRVNRCNVSLPSLGGLARLCRARRLAQVVLAGRSGRRARRSGARPAPVGGARRPVRTLLEWSL